MNDFISMRLTRLLFKLRKLGKYKLQIMMANLLAIFMYENPAVHLLSPGD